MNLLQLERKKNKLDVDQLAEFFWKSKSLVEVLKHNQKIAENDPIVK